MPRRIITLLYFAAFICRVSIAEEDRLRIFTNDESSNDFANLLNSLIKINEQRMKLVHKMNRLQDVGALRDVLRNSNALRNRLNRGRNGRNLLVLIVSNNHADSASNDVSFEDTDDTYANVGTVTPEIRRFDIYGRRSAAEDQDTMPDQFQTSNNDRNPNVYREGFDLHIEKIYKPTNELNFKRDSFQNAPHSGNRTSVSKIYRNVDSIRGLTTRNFKVGKQSKTYENKIRAHRITQPFGDYETERPKKKKKRMKPTLSDEIDTHNAEFLLKMNRPRKHKKSGLRLSGRQEKRKTKYHRPNKRDKGKNHDKFQNIDPKRKEFSEVRIQDERISEHPDERLNNHQDERISIYQDELINKYQDKRINKYQDERKNKHQDEKMNKHQDERMNKHQDERLYKHQDERVYKYQDQRINKHQDERNNNHQDEKVHKYQDERRNKHQDARMNKHQDEKINKHQDERIKKHQDERMNKHQDVRISKNQDERIHKYQDERINKHRESETYLHYPQTEIITKKSDKYKNVPKTYVFSSSKPRNDRLEPKVEITEKYLEIRKKLDQSEPHKDEFTLTVINIDDKQDKLKSKNVGRETIKEEDEGPPLPETNVKKIQKLSKKTVRIPSKLPTSSEIPSSKKKGPLKRLKVQHKPVVTPASIEIGIIDKHNGNVDNNFNDKLDTFNNKPHVKLVENMEAKVGNKPKFTKTKHEHSKINMAALKPAIEISEQYDKYSEIEDESDGDSSESEVDYTESRGEYSEPEYKDYKSEYYKPAIIKDVLRDADKGKKKTLRKGWLKCMGKKARKLCRKSCNTAYLNVCQRLKCTSRAKKDLKTQCKRSCKNYFESSKYSAERTGRMYLGSDSDSWSR